MPITRIATVSAGSSDGDNVTTGAIDTTGALLLVACVARVGAATLTDSKGNSWTALSLTSYGGIYYSQPTSVGSGHTFSLASTGTFPSVAVAAYAGTNTTSPFDQQSATGDTGGGTTASTGSVTPSENNELLVAFAGGGATLSSIDASFTIRESVALVSSQHYACALADQIQTTITARNPTWTFSGATDGRASIATFRAARMSQMFAVFT